MKNYKAIDLFCGAGGFSLGLEKAGFEILCAVDNWEKAVATYRLNFHHPVLESDIRKFDFRKFIKKENLQSSEVDLVVGGPPCQGFSIQRIGDDTDSRNDLILEYARVVISANPKVFIMENVPGILGKRGKEYISDFLKKIETKYNVEFHKIDASEFGVPQSRKRVLCIGTRKDLPLFELHTFFKPTTKVRTVRDALKDLPTPLSETKKDPLHRKSKLSEINQRRIELIPPGGGMIDLPVELRANCHKKGADKIGHRYVYGRLAPDEPACTITAKFDSFTRGKFGHPWEPRNLTLREGARLQSFPDTFSFHGTQEEIAAQIGNAVPPLVAKKVGEAVQKWLDQIPKTHSFNRKLQECHGV